MTAKRPVGLTILAFALWILCVPAILVAVVAPFPIPLRALSMAYGAVALVTGIAIWQRKPWAPTAFATWSCIVLLTAMFEAIYELGSPLKGATFIIIVGGLLWLAYRYVRKSTIIGA